jgi:hypothetical protein
MGGLEHLYCRSVSARRLGRSRPGPANESPAPFLGAKVCSTRRGAKFARERNPDSGNGARMPAQSGSTDGGCTAARGRIGGGSGSPAVQLSKTRARALCLLGILYEACRPFDCGSETIVTASRSSAVLATATSASEAAMRRPGWRPNPCPWSFPRTSSPNDVARVGEAPSARQVHHTPGVGDSAGRDAEIGQEEVGHVHVDWARRGGPVDDAGRNRTVHSR